MPFALYVVAGPDSGRRYAFEREATLGRTTESDVVVQDDLASRTHARIFSEGHRVFIEDSGSANGTKVDGRRLREAMRLRGGEVISIGAVSIEFETARDVTAVEPDDEQEDMRSTMDTSEPPQGTMFDADTSAPELPRPVSEPSVTPVKDSSTALLQAHAPEAAVEQIVFTKKPVEEATALRTPHRPPAKRSWGRVFADVVLGLLLLAALIGTAIWAIPIFREALANP